MRVRVGMEVGVGERGDIEKDKQNRKRQRHSERNRQTHTQRSETITHTYAQRQ